MLFRSLSDSARALKDAGEWFARQKDRAVTAIGFILDLFQSGQRYDPEFGTVFPRATPKTPSEEERRAATLASQTIDANKIRKQLDAAEQDLSFQQMNPAEQRAEIERRRNEIAKQFPAQDPLEEQQLRQKDLELRKLSLGIQNQYAVSLNPLSISQPKVDALTAIGGSLLGGVGSLNIPTKQLEVMKQNLDELKILNQQFNQSFGQ